MLSFAITVFLIAGGCWIADRFDFFKNQPIRQGVWCGALSVALNIFNINLTTVGYNISFTDLPAVIAALFYGPLAGGIAGSISGITRVGILLLSGNPWWLECAGALFPCFICAIFNRIAVFDNDRPDLISMIIVCAFDQLLFLGLFFLLGALHIQQVCEITLALALPLFIGGGIIGGVSWLVCRRFCKPRKSPAGSALIPVVAFALIFVAEISLTIWDAQVSLIEIQKSAQDKVRNLIDGRIRFFTCNSALNICREINHENNVSGSRLQDLADAHQLDTVTIISKDKKVIATTTPQIFKCGDDLCSVRDFSDFFSKMDQNGGVTLGWRRGGLNPNSFSFYVGVPSENKEWFLLVGCSTERLSRDFKDWFLADFNDLAVYNSGFICVVAPDNRILNHPKGHHEFFGQDINQCGFRQKSLSLLDFTIFYNRIAGCLSYSTLVAQIGQWRIYSVIPIRDTYFYTLRDSSIVGLLLFALCFYFRWTKIRIEKKQKLIDDLRAENDRQMKEDLQLARYIQESELKNGFWITDWFRIKAKMTPVKSVGGDFYDYYELPDGRIAFGIADVSGKGMSAAIFMMKARTTLNLYSVSGGDIVSVMQQTNDHLCEQNTACMFTTAWGCIYDSKTRELEYVCAGHNPPILVKNNGVVQVLSSNQEPPMGIRKGFVYHSLKLQLESGDRLFLYTDGVTDAIDKGKQRYGEKRLLATLAASVHNPVIPLVDLVQQSLDEFTKGMEQFDDITMLSLWVK